MSQRAPTIEAEPFVLDALMEQIETGRALVDNGDAEGSIPVLEGAVRAALEAGRPHTAAVGRIALALALEAVGDPIRAATEAHAAAEVLEHYGDIAGSARAYSVAALVSSQAGDLAATVDDLPRAMLLVRDAGPDALLVPALMNVGLALAELGGFDQAMPYLFRALALAQSGGNGGDLANARTNLAFVEERWAARLRLAGRDGEADARLRRAIDHGIAALDRSADTTSERDAIFIRSDLARCYAQIGLADAALEVVLPALSMDERTSNRGAMGQAHLAAALAYRRLGLLDDAERHLAAASERIDQFALGPSLALVRGEIAEICRERGQLSEALDALDEVRRIEQGIAQLREERLVDSVLARVQGEVAQRESEHRHGEMIELQRTNAELRSLAEGLWVASFEDALTGLPNRRSLDERLRLLQSQAAVRPLALSIAIVDVDHFKRVNDEHSHSAGDEVLTRLGALLRRYCRSADLVARYGGEEFIVVFERTGEDEAVAVAERLREAVEEADWSFVDPGLRLTISVGVAGGVDVVDPTELLATADQRLLAAKSGSRNVVVASGSEPMGD